MDLKLIIPAGTVPENAIVTKVTGTVKYTVKRTLTVYEDDDIRENPHSYREILALEGTVLLVGEGGSINAIHNSKDVVWRPNSINALVDYLQEWWMLCDEDAQLLRKE